MITISPNRSALDSSVRQRIWEIQYQLTARRVNYGVDFDIDFIIHMTTDVMYLSTLTPERACDYGTI